MDPQQVVGLNQLNCLSGSRIMNNSSGNIENVAVLEFQAGVSAVLRSWSALKTYVSYARFFFFWFGDTL